MLSINRDGHFLLIEAVKKITSQNQLTETVTVKMTASVNTHIFRGGSLIKCRLS